MLPEDDIELALSSDGLEMVPDGDVDSLLYPWDEVHCVKAALQSDDPEDMEVLTFVIKGIGLFSFECDDARLIRQSCIKWIRHVQQQALGKDALANLNVDAMSSKLFDDTDFKMSNADAMLSSSGLSREAKLALFEGARAVAVKHGQYVFQKGDVADRVYVVNSGQLGVTDSAGKQVATLNPGQLFGERALRGPEDESSNGNGSWNLVTQRSANVLALRRCELLELDQSRFDNIRDRHPEVVAALNPGILPGLGLSKEVKIELFQSGRTLVLDKDQGLFDEGDEAASVFIVMSGVLSVVAAVGGTGAMEEVSLLKEGQLFGERALHAVSEGEERPRRSAGVKAVSSSRVLEIQHGAFANLQKKHPSLMQALDLHSFDHSEYDETQALRMLHGHLLAYAWTDPTGLLPCPKDDDKGEADEEDLPPVGIFCSAAGVQLLDLPAGVLEEEAGADDEEDRGRAARIRVLLSYSWDRVGEVKAKEQAVVADPEEDLMELFEFHVDMIGTFAFECDDSRDLRGEFRKYKGGDESGGAIEDLQFDANQEQEFDDYTGGDDYNGEAEYEEWEEDFEDGDDDDDDNEQAASTPTAAALAGGAQTTPKKVGGMRVAAGSSPMAMATVKAARAKQQPTRIEWSVFLRPAPGHKAVSLPGLEKKLPKLQAGKKSTLTYSETMLILCGAGGVSAVDQGGALLAAYPWERVYSCETEKQTVKLGLGATATVVVPHGAPGEGTRLATVELQCIDQADADQISADINLILTLFGRGGSSAVIAGMEKLPPWKAKAMAKKGVLPKPLQTGASPVASALTKMVNDREQERKQLEKEQRRAFTAGEGGRKSDLPPARYVHSMFEIDGMKHVDWIQDFAHFPLAEYLEMWPVPMDVEVGEVITRNGRDTYVIVFSEEIDEEPFEITWARSARFHDMKELQAVGLEERDRLVGGTFPHFRQARDEMKTLMTGWLRALVMAARKQSMEGRSTAALLSFLYAGAEKTKKQMKKSKSPKKGDKKERTGERERKKSAKTYEDGMMAVEKEMKLVCKMTSHQHHADAKVQKLRKLLQKVAQQTEEAACMGGVVPDTVTIGKEVYENREPTSDMKKRRSRVVELLNRTQRDLSEVHLVREQIMNIEGSAVAKMRLSEHHKSRRIKRGRYLATLHI
jgi:CRP-like cAMP-binding protein